MFYDDFEVTNPLGSKTGIHKVGALYFTIRNLPFQFNSKCANIHLIALFLCKDLKNKNVDFNTILYPIISDIRVLENTGVKVDNIFIKGTLVSVAHDNLAANLCFGFVCSFRADYYCRFCTIHRDEAKHSVVENNNLLRKHTEYNEILSSVPGVTFLDTKTTKGIKNSCEINNLSHYKIFESHNVDVMHDILEGAVPFVLKLFFKKLTEGKYLSITDINDKIKNFNFGYLQNTCIPPKITLDKKCRTSIGLSASQNLCLILHLPFIFFNFYDILPRFWIGVTSLIRIIKVALSSVLKQQHIQSLKDDIELHLKCIIEVYGEILLPKHHFLTHYPSVLKKMGPLIHTWAMRYEAKHREFIRDASVINNYKNICKSLANRYQTKMSITWESMTFQNEFLFDKLRSLSFEDLDLSVQHYLSKTFTSNKMPHVFKIKKFECTYGYCYKSEFTLYLRKENGLLTFGKIKNIYVVDNEIYLSLEFLSLRNLIPFCSVMKLFQQIFQN